MSAGWSILIIVLGGLAAVTWVLVDGEIRTARMRQRHRLDHLRRDMPERRQIPEGVVGYSIRSAERAKRDG